MTTSLGAPAQPKPFNPFEAVSKKVTNTIADQLSAHASDAMAQGMAPKDVFVMLGQLLGTGESRMGVMPSQPPQQPQETGLPTPQAPPPQQGQQVLQSLLQTTPGMSGGSGGVPPTPPPGNQRQTRDQSVQLLQALLSHPQINQAVQDVVPGLAQGGTANSTAQSATRQEQMGERPGYDVVPPSSIFSRPQLDQKTGKFHEAGFLQRNFVEGDESYLNKLGAVQKMTGNEPIQPTDQMKAYLEYAKTRSTNALQQENKVSDDFTKSIEEYNTILPRYASLRDIILDPKKQYANGISDLVAINEALKIIDPKSVNREGEVKTLSEAEHRLGKAGLTLSRAWRNGQFISPEGRKQLLQAMTTKYRELAKDADRSYKLHSKKIQAYGGDPTRALIFNTLPDEKKQTSSASDNGFIDLGDGFTLRKK